MSIYFTKPSDIAELARSKAAHINTLSDAVETAFDLVDAGAGVQSFVTKTSSAVLSAVELSGNTTLHNDGAIAEVILTWRPLVDTQQAFFYVNDAQYLQIKAPAATTIRIGAIQSAAAGYVRSNVVGSWIKIKAMPDELVVSGYGGVWTYDE